MEIKRHYRPEKVKKYEARWYVEGKLKYRFFATERERDQFADIFSEQVARQMVDAIDGSLRFKRYLIMESTIN